MLDKPVVKVPVSIWERHPELSGLSAGEEGRISRGRQTSCDGRTDVCAAGLLPNKHSYGGEPRRRRNTRNPSSREKALNIERERGGERKKIAVGGRRIKKKKKKKKNTTRTSRKETTKEKHTIKKTK